MYVMKYVISPSCMILCLLFSISMTFSTIGWRVKSNELYISTSSDHCGSFIWFFFFNSWDLFSYVCVRTCANLWSFKLMFVIVSVPMICSPVAYILISLAAHAGTNKAASSSTSLNTRKLDEDTENLARKFLFFTSVFILYIVRIFFICYTVLG